MEKIMFSEQLLYNFFTFNSSTLKSNIFYWILKKLIYTTQYTQHVFLRKIIFLSSIEDKPFVSM